MKDEKCRVQSAKCRGQRAERGVRGRGVLRYAVAILQLAVVLAAPALADPTIQVAFSEKGAYLYWFEFKDAGQKLQVTAPKRVAGDAASIDLAPASVSGKLAAGELKVYDPKTGNLAAKSLQNLAGKTELKLKSADFDRVRTVRIVLKPAEASPDERVESSVVTLKDANSEEFTTLVDPSSEGVAEFHDIAGGQESVTVGYDGRKMTVDLEVPLDREEPVFTDTLAVSGKVRTVKASAAAASAKAGKGEGAAPRKGRVRAGPIGWAPIAAGILFLGLVGGMLYAVLRTRGRALEGGLRKLGVQLPEEQAAGSAPGAPGQQIDPSVCPFCGQKKDPITGNCACSVDAAGMRQGPSGTAATPRLIGMQGPYAGRIFELTGSETTIGRDAANAAALTDDSTSSRRHARIGRENGEFSITDEGSSNGTFVNGARITGRQVLQPGDEVQIGSTKFRFEV